MRWRFSSTLPALREIRGRVKQYNPSMPKRYESTADFLHRLRRFVQQEADAQQEMLERQWARPLGERVARGWTVEGLRLTHSENSLIRLACQTNQSRFREGDLVVLHQGRPKDSNALHAELQYDGETDLELSLVR